MGNRDEEIKQLAKIAYSGYFGCGKVQDDYWPKEFKAWEKIAEVILDAGYSCSPTSTEIRPYTIAEKISINACKSIGESHPCGCTFSQENPAHCLKCGGVLGREKKLHDCSCNNEGANLARTVRKITDEIWQCPRCGGVGTVNGSTEKQGKRELSDYSVLEIEI